MVVTIQIFKVEENSKFGCFKLPGSTLLLVSAGLENSEPLKHLCGPKVAYIFEYTSRIANQKMAALVANPELRLPTSKVNTEALRQRSSVGRPLPETVRFKTRRDRERFGVCCTSGHLIQKASWVSS